ncbi:MAG: adenosylmethionine decarboxylase [Sulfolobales archaeon]|nr:adenosylmethionine decarboxylase [Sulfolobales archaeon]MCX8185541.1 adenosylmethionine decarboxylase [Sulfolobales archaeon]MDW7969980.1 adenosylmethionine decarboxylase [Sulfolobales archaeon]
MAQTQTIGSSDQALNLEGIIGKHIFANLYDADPNIINDEDFLRNLIKDAARLANMTLIEVKSWKVEGTKGGVSVLALITESHIALHTWVEYRFATLDIYTCGEKSDPWTAFEYLVSMLKPKTFRVNYSDRSSTPPIK